MSKHGSSLRRVAAIAAGGAVCLALAGGSSVAGTAKAAQGGPMLSLRALRLAPPAATAGGSFALAGKVRNRGDRRRSVLIEVFLRGGADRSTAVGSRRLRVSAHGRRLFTLEAFVPAGLQEGDYPVAVCVSRRGAPERRSCRRTERELAVSEPSGPPPPPPTDSDGDGLPDSYDVCPATAGVPQYGGCPAPPDGDGDGIVDDEDACPDQAGVPLYHGCPDPPPPPPEYVSGARTLGDPLFPEVGNGGYDVKHYDVHLNYTNLTNTFLTGTETVITAEAIQNLSDFSLDLQGLTVTGVTVDGQAASFSRSTPPECSPASPPNLTCPESKLLVTPATPIDFGEVFIVDVDYVGSPVRHRDADGTDEGWLNTPSGDGAFVVNEPVGAMTWLPSNNHPLDKATYDFDLTVPTGKTALGNGEQTAPPTDNGDGTTTWHWAEDVPMATYLSTTTVGDFDLVRTTGSGLEFNNAVDSLATQAQKDAVKVSTDREEAIVNFQASLYGAYPFDSAGVVADNAGNVGYVLEVQTKIHFPSPSVSVNTLSHELAHQWFGDNVSLTTWKDIWQNEGWATWSQWYWSHEENGSATSPAAQFDNNYTAGTGPCPSPLNKWCTPPADPDAAGLFATFPVYTRPAMMLQALREIVGDTKFFTIASQWNADHAYGNANTAQFMALSKQVSGFTGADLVKLDTFFQQWLYSPEMPSITGDNF